MRPQELFASLEPRRMLAAFTVTNLNDSGAGSLRSAIAAANAAGGADTVDFAPSVFGTIPLAGTEYNITDSLTINGPGSSSMILDAGAMSRIFTVQAGKVVVLNGLRMINGAVGDNGAGIRNFGNLTINDSSVVGNTSGSSGAGIFSIGTLTLNNVAIGGNTSHSSGGGIHISSGTATINTSTISGNFADASAAGIFNQGALTINGSSIADNIASTVTPATSGGGIFTQGGAVTINNSTFSGNIAGAGGAIHADSGALTISNSTVSGNAANFAGTGGGGGIFLTGNTATIRNSTIASNTSTDAGGGIAFDGGSSVTIISTILGGNTTVATANDIFGTLQAGSVNNLVQDGSTAGGLINGINRNILDADPLLAPLTFNGGLTATMALGAGSPAIGNGSNPDGLLTDQRQGPFLRIITSAVDSGSFQRQSLAMVVDIIADENDGNYAAGDLSLREALAAAGPNPGNDTVTFAPALNAQTLALSLGQLDITGDLTLTGPTTGTQVISAGNISRVFSIAFGSVVSMSGLSITNGRANANAGGGIDNSGTLTLSTSSLSGNTADNNGGAINSSGTMTIRDTNISGNTAIDGGGIFNSGMMSIVRSGLLNNVASGIGGGIYSTNRVDIGSSAVTGNTAAAGGGIFSSGNLNLVGVTLDNNAATADMGGGIFATGGTVTVLNSTITRNNSALNGGGIAVSLIPVKLVSTIVAGNETVNVLNDINATLGSDSTNNLITDSVHAGGLVDGVNGNNLGVDPVVGPLAFNGGPTMTVALLAGSPAINSGLNPNSLTTDQRGQPRIRGLGIDIGAFEFSAPPTLTSVSANALTLVQGDAVILTSVGAADADGNVSVLFYVDRNNNGVADDGELLGTDATSGDGFTLSLTSEQSGTLPTGAVKFLAVAMDSDSLFSAPVLSAASTITYSIRAGAGDTVSGFANPATDNLTVGTVNSAGNPIVFEAASPWNARDLAAQTGAPMAIDNMVVWVDPKDNLTYASYPSAVGLILLRRAGDGVWSFRNLNTELAGSQLPTKSLTQFASANGTVVIAGLMDDGKILAFIQTADAPVAGDYQYSFINITDTDLAPQGFTSPVVQKLISYRPAWDAWHLAGIDADGKIWSVWVSPATFTRWRSDDLSAITGAPPVAKGLSVLLTSWGGINLTALDADGKVSVTWWVPEFGADWNNNNLSDETPGSSPLTSLTGYYSSWDGMNYTGLNADGQILVYWWVPSFGGSWVVSDLTGGLPAEQPRPVTDLTAHASALGTFNIFGAAANGDVVRTWWSPAANVWTLEDLSSTATRL